MIVRAYTPEDFATVQAWAEARGEAVLPDLLGKVGFLTEDEKGPCAVVFVYLMFDVPVAVVDNFFTRPRQSIKQSRTAWRRMWRCILGYLANLKDCNDAPLRYKLVRTFCRAELARFMEADNWILAEHDSRQISFILP